MDIHDCNTFESIRDWTTLFNLPTNFLYKLSFFGVEKYLKPQLLKNSFIDFDRFLFPMWLI